MIAPIPSVNRPEYSPLAALHIGQRLLPKLRGRMRGAQAYVPRGPTPPPWKHRFFVAALNSPLSVCNTRSHARSRFFSSFQARRSVLAHVPYGYIAEANDVPSRLQRTCFSLAVPARERSLRRACRVA